jgi:hypothetical protein
MMCVELRIRCATIVGCATGAVGWDIAVGLVAFLAAIGVIADLFAVRSFALSTHEDARPVADRWRLVGLSVVDALLYRHLLLLFRIYGTWQQFNEPNISGTIERRGFGSEMIKMLPTRQVLSPAIQRGAGLP